MPIYILEYIVFLGLFSCGIIAYALYKLDIKIKIDTELMKCESFIESRLYRAVVLRGFYVRTQMPCGKYRIDIALPTYRIAIECDGRAYHSTPEQNAHDRRKNSYLRRHGWRVLRFSGSEINWNLSKVISKIEKVVNNP